jgi:hypothetical protein
MADDGIRQADPSTPPIFPVRVRRPTANETQTAVRSGHLTHLLASTKSPCSHRAAQYH